MKIINTEHIKYGIGITADYSLLNLNLRTGKKGSIREIQGAKHFTLENFINIELGIADNIFFTYILDNTKDSFKICIDRDISLYPLELKAINNSAFAYLRIVVKKNVHVTIHEKIVPKDFIGCIIDVIAEKGANVVYIADQRTEEGTSSIILRRAFIKSEASVKLIDVEIGGSISNSTIYALLDGYGAVGEIYGLFYGTGKQFYDIAHTTIHSAPYTKSNLKTNGVLDQKSSAIYRSLIDIQENAYNAEGKQKKETLLLSSSAQISAVPDLKIANNEVKCSHGVSTTNIDDESLFYLHSRGFSHETAKHAILEGHLNVITDMIENESIQLRIADTIIRKL